MSSIAYQRISGNNNGAASVASSLSAPATIKSGTNVISSVDAGGLVVPAAINPSTFYVAEEFDRTSTSYSTAGTNGTNYNFAPVNTISAAIFGASNLGGAYLGTTTTAQGGYIAAGASLNIVKSSAITYQWRGMFYVGTLSDATNPYTLLVGGWIINGSATTASTPLCGPYLSYTHGANSGRWVLGSAWWNGASSTQTTANSTTAVTTGWHTYTITLANGVYTYAVDGATLGTVTESSMLTTPNNNQSASIAAIAILPGGAWTTARYAAIDRADFYVTGLSR
jgi:hypothetical protein